MTSKPLFVTYCAKDFLDGTVMLDPMEELAYRRVCDLIYVTDDQLPDDDKKLGWMTKTGKRWKVIKAALIETGKITVEGGFIRNERCRKELLKSHANLSSKVVGGKASAETGKSLQNLKQHRTGVRKPVRQDPPPLTEQTTERPTEVNRKPLTVDKIITPHSPPSSAVAEGLFDRFWKVYPSRGDASNPKKPAKEKFNKMVSGGHDPEAIIQGAATYARKCAVMRIANTPSVVQATRFLNEERWVDENEKAAPTPKDMHEREYGRPWL